MIVMRLGQVLLRLLARSVGASRRAMARAFRLVHGRLSHDTRRRMLDWGEDHLPAGLMQRLRRANRQLKSPPSGPPGAGTRTRNGGDRAPRGVLSENLPVYGYLLFDVEPDELARRVRTIRTRAAVHGDHVPLIVTDSVAFGHLRDAAVAFEYVPGPDAWRLAGIDGTWDQFLRARLDHLTELHGIERSVVVTGSAEVVDALTGI